MAPQLACSVDPLDAVDLPRVAHQGGTHLGHLWGVVLCAHCARVEDVWACHRSVKSSLWIEGEHGDAAVRSGVGRWRGGSLHGA